MSPIATSISSVELAPVTAILTDYLNQHTKQAQTISAAYASLWQEIERLISAGGKRLRPQMVLLAYQALGGNDPSVIAPLAAASELLHQSMLIHDDIIDRDTIRYGVPNISGAYREQYSALIADDDTRRHFADSAALLAGDMLLAGAYQTLYSASLTPAVTGKIAQVFNHSLFEVIGGELIDTEAAFRGASADRALTIARYKTAGYSFIAPLLIGAIAAGADETAQEHLRQFAEQLGIAFQLQDDVLGTFGNETLTGKSASGDIKEGKRTFMVESFYNLATPEQLTLFESLYGKADATSNEVGQVRQLLLDSGARSQVELKISQLEAGAITALAALKLPLVWHNEFINVINKSLKRTV